MNYLNLADMFFNKREKFADRTAYMYKSGDQWISVTFKDAVNQAEKIAAGLAALGVKKGDFVALISANRLEWALTDYAVLALGAVLVPIYPTLMKDQINYILNDSGARVLIVSDAQQIEKVNSVIEQIKSVQHFFAFDSESGLVKPWQTYESLYQTGENFLQNNANYISDSIFNISRDDVATVIYTSGTTGEAKGVILTHNNFLSNIESASQIFECAQSDVFLSFLPLSHILERTAGHYFSCYHAATVAYAESIDTVAANILEIRPTIMISVPRLYEKMYSRILNMVEHGPAVKRRIFWWAVNSGREFTKKITHNQTVPGALKLKLKLADKLVFHKIKERVGGRLRFFISGGAPLAAEIGEFFSAAGLVILEGYGLTETSPGITFNSPDAFRFGTVGKAIPGVEVKIAEDGEILTRGPHVMRGYLNREADTSEVIQSDGWFHTGDIGIFDKDGFLIITDRKKNIIVTSGGKNIAPQPIENQLITSKYIEQAVVIGDKRRFCSAIIIPSKENIEQWAQKENISFSVYIDLLANEKVETLIQSEIERLTENFASFERIKKFCLIAEPFTQESGELTPSLKIKRKVVEQKFAAEIEKMYEEERME